MPDLFKKHGLRAIIVSQPQLFFKRSKPSIPSNMAGVALTEVLAQEIYRHKIQLESKNIRTSGARIKGPSAAIARLYNVSAKTVRDIWNRVTWKYATSHMWTASEPSEEESLLHSEVVSLFFENAGSI
jgi:hypothetical protein